MIVAKQSPSNTSEPKFLSVSEAIRFSGLSRTTLYVLRKENKIKWFNPVGNKILILKKSLNDFIEKSGSQF